MRKAKLILDGETFDVNVDITCIQSFPKMYGHETAEGRYIHDYTVDYDTYCFEGYWTEVKREIGKE